MSMHVVNSYATTEGGTIHPYERVMVIREKGIELDKALVAAQLRVPKVAAIWTEEGYCYDFILNDWRDFYIDATIANEKAAFTKAATTIIKDPASQSIAEVLAERGSRYGSFSGHAAITQGIKAWMKDTPKWSDLSDSQKEALEMVAHKIGRILNGDPNYLDSWVDIVGYTQLIVDQLNGKNT